MLDMKEPDAIEAIGAPVQVNFVPFCSKDRDLCFLAWRMLISFPFGHRLQLSLGQIVKKKLSGCRKVYNLNQVFLIL